MGSFIDIACLNPTTWGAKILRACPKRGRVRLVEEWGVQEDKVTAAESRQAPTQSPNGFNCSMREVRWARRMSAKNWGSKDPIWEDILQVFGDNCESI